MYSRAPQVTLVDYKGDPVALESGSGGGGGATETTLVKVADAIAPDAKPDAHFIIAGVGAGTIPAGARYARFAIPPGGTGTIIGTPYTDVIQEVPFDAIPGGHNAIAYEVTAGNLYITYAL